MANAEVTFGSQWSTLYKSILRRAGLLPSVIIDAEGVEDVEQGGDEGKKLEGGESDCYRQIVPAAAHPSKGPTGPEAQLATYP